MVSVSARYLFYQQIFSAKENPERLCDNYLEVAGGAGGGGGAELEN